MEKLAERKGYGDGDGLRAAYFPARSRSTRCFNGEYRGYRAPLQRPRMNLGAFCQ